MPIIIIATEDPFGDITPAVAPTTQPIQPVSVQPERHVQPAQPSLQLDDLYSLIRKYQNPQSPEDRDDALQGIMNHPYQGSTLGSWLKYKLKKSENPQQEAMLMTMYVLDRYLPGEKFLGKLNEEVKAYFSKSHSTGLQDSMTKGPQSRTMESAMQRFLPYLKGTETIDDDIAEQFQNKAQQIWEQYRRDSWNNFDNRIDKAKVWVAQQVAQIAASSPNIVAQFPGFSADKFKAKDYQIARNILGAAGLAQQIEDQSSPYWLTQEMVDPAKRGIGPGYIEKAFQQGLGGVLCIEDKDENDVQCQGVGKDISSKDVERGKNYSGGNVQDMSEIERKELRKNLPESYRSGVPEERSQEVMNRQKILSMENKYFTQTMKYLAKRMYAPNSTREDAACSLVLRLQGELEQSKGNKASSMEALKINRSRKDRLLEQNYNLFDRSLNLRDEPGAADEELGADARFSLVWSQVFKDLTRYIADDNKYNQMISDLNLKVANAAEFRRVLMAMIRTANFVGLNKYANV